MDHRRGDLAGVGCGEGNGEEGIVLKGLAGVIDEGERGERGGAEPVTEEGSDILGGGGIGSDGFGARRRYLKKLVVGGTGGLGGNEEAGSAEADGGGGKVDGSDAVGFGDGGVGLLDDMGEGLAAAIEKGVDRRLANVFDGEAEMKGRGRLLEA
jgi:hypothetical protein